MGKKKKRKNPRWTKKQLSNLKKYYKDTTLTQKQLAHKIGRSFKSIRRKASLLGYKRKKTIEVKKGDRFGFWIVTKIKASKPSHLVCKCDCGTTKEVAKGSLTSGKSTGCMKCAKKKLSTLYKKRIKVKCSFCSKELERIQYRADKNTENFCNRTCQKEFFKKKWQENPPNWKKLKKLRRTPAYRSWSKSIKEIGGYQCLRCGRTDRQLNSHHLSSFTLYPKQRFDLKNGVCLCVPCHTEFHQIYKDFTPNDLYHFCTNYFQIVFYGRQKTKSNNYKMGNNNFYIDSKVRKYETELKNLAKKEMKKQGLSLLTTPITMDVVFYVIDKRRRDIDNLMKTVADALNKVVYKDDSLICVIHMQKRLDRDNPRTEIEIGALDPNNTNYF